MVQVLEAVPSFSTQMARALGGGISQGVQSASDVISKLYQEKAKEAQREKLLKSLGIGMPNVNSQNFTSESEERSLPQQLSSQQENEAPSWIENITPEQEIALSLYEPDLAKTVESIRQSKQKERTEERKYAQEETKPLKEEMRNTRSEALNTAHSLDLIQEAISGANSWEGYADALANITGIENFRTRKGAELRSGIKNYFLSDLSRIKGGRPNQLIENQLLDAYQKMGRDPIANQKVLVGQKAKNKLVQEKMRLFDELEDKYLSQGKHLPANSEYIINKKLKPFADKLEKQMIRDLDRLTKLGTATYKSLQKQLKKGEVLMFDPEGNPNAVEKDEIKDLESQGWLRI